jgi:type I restriction enzyme R subunit
MRERPRSERKTQERVLKLLAGAIGDGGLGYRLIGDLSEQDDNRCVRADDLQANLADRGYSPAHVARALEELRKAVDATGVSLAEANLRTYNLLRYGAQVKLSEAKPHETVHLIDWDHPEKNDFAVAEEVTLKGGYERRPDIVLYFNGIAMVVIELKRASVEVGDGVRQLITNQEEIFNKPFFSTVQLLVAGSDSQGVRYGTTGTPEQFFVEWKLERGTEPSLAPGALLDRPLAELCDPEQLLDMIRNCVIFEAGQKKIPRPHQFRGFKAARARIQSNEGGVIWHTQGSGKSILMVMLAKWLLENDAQARILVVTDRDELDRQIEGVMQSSGVGGAESKASRVTSRAGFVAKLSTPNPRLICALIHKFDTSWEEGDPPRIHGRFYVFVDECHRTQSGAMHRTMKKWLGGAIFIGFTGTPLLRADKQMTRDVFGTYIHTYKFHEGVEDGVILDLKYEARDVPQVLSNPAAIDLWFESKTKNLNSAQKAVLRERWATMEKMMSSAERKSRVITDIIQDFDLKPRLNNNRGTALLVVSSIYDACHYFRLFQAHEFGKRVGIITSFEPNANLISRESKGSDEWYKFETYTEHVLDQGQTTTQYEQEAKRRFVQEPSNMKLLIVVSKLLTGFDAPSCTYIYLDNQLRDHNLFQAICRTNRLDGEDKEYGHIVDYKEMFGRVQDAIAVYSADDLDDDLAGGGSNNVEIKNWLSEGILRLEAALETVRQLCEPIPSPRNLEQYLYYFCGDATDPEALNDTEILRMSYYKSVAALTREYAEMVPHLEEGGYTTEAMTQLRQEVETHVDNRGAIKRHAGEELDIKPYEADMRHLINTYIQADPATTIDTLGELSLAELIVKLGIAEAVQTINKKGRLSPKSIAEGIINNLRIVIIRERLTDPQFYEQMSVLLNDLIAQRRESTEEYKEFLRKAGELAKKAVAKSGGGDLPPELVDKPGAQYLFRNLPKALAPSHAIAEPGGSSGATYLALAIAIDLAMREGAPAGWRGDQPKEAQVKNVLFPLLGHNRDQTIAVFELIKNSQGNW